MALSPEARLELSVAAVVLVVLTTLAAALSTYGPRLAAWWHDEVHEGAR